MGFFKKATNKKYKELENYSYFINNLLASDHFISKKEYASNKEKVSNIVEKFLLMYKEEVLVDWCKKKRISYKKLLKLIKSFQNTDNSIKRHNDEYVNKHLIIDKEILDNLLIKDDVNIKLDEEQRRVVLSDEDYTLVVAGAGAGKTTTIEAKVKYLVDVKGINPDRVLIVSFTRKATEELKERFKRLDLPARIATFHSIGNAIISESENERHQIVNQGFMYKVIEEYLLTNLDDEYFIKKILLFFASYLNMPFEVENVSLLFKTLSANDTTTIKSDLAQILDDYHKEQTKKKITMNDERTRSVDECRIANFLYINGIDYIYEPVYRHGFNDTTKPYCPDFLIKYKGQEIYLEHFGISEEGQNTRFTSQELSEYKKHINDKIKLHREHKTQLIYTFSKYKDGRDLITHLGEKLTDIGIKFETKNNIEIYKRLASQAENKYFSKFILLVCNFINRFKVCNYDFNTKFDEWQHSIKSERTKLFMEIAKRCFHVYETKKMEIKAIDFEDMINNASNVLDKMIAEHDLLPYDYILVDEYQDISLQRFDLCEKLSKASNAKIVAVGDDWQSIFRFSGAKIDLFTKFEEKMGYANILKITNTYRNSQELIDIAGGFVMENQKQIKKTLKSNKSIKDPVILMSYDDSYEKDDKEHGPFYRLGEAIEYSLDDIVAKNGLDSTVLLIGRYNFDGKNLLKLEEFFFWDGKNLKSKKYPELDISFMTAHSSKGLGRDNVIIVNGKDDVLGFPSKIEDDPVMKLVIKDDELMDFEEERRLFYVALTRTKNRVYIITPQNRPSKFVLELKDKFTNVILKGAQINPSDLGYAKHKCPICGYPLQRRISRFKFLNATKKLWICSNDPEVCGFLTNDLNGNIDKLSISKCPNCYDGYLIIKPIKDKKGLNKEQRMLGCTNYKKDGTGCNFTMYGYNYTQEKGKILIDNDGRIRRSEIKAEINGILGALSNIYTQYSGFKMTHRSLINFFISKEDKTIMSFGLQDKQGYGMFKEKKGYLKKLIVALYDFDVLKIIQNEKGYKNVHINQDAPTDSQILMIEAYMSCNFINS